MKMCSCLHISASDLKLLMGGHAVLAPVSSVSRHTLGTGPIPSTLYCEPREAIY